jgi:propionyl-CoA carboxylase alpha chain
MRSALDAFVVRGPEQNVAFLSALLAHPRFVEGRLTTGFIAEEYGERFKGRELPVERRRALAAVAVAMRIKEAARAASISGQLRGYAWRPERDWHVELGAEGFEVVLQAKGELSALEVDGHAHAVELAWRPGLPAVRAVVDGSAFTLQADPISEGYLLRHDGAELKAIVRTARAAEFAARMPKKEIPDSSKLLRSPMPGLILRVAVAAGQEVKAGQELLVLEAMTMENVLRADQDGAVAEVRVAARDTVSADQVLLIFA